MTDQKISRAHTTDVTEENVAAAVRKRLGLNPDVPLMPGQWVNEPTAKAPATLGSRVVKAVREGRKLGQLATELEHTAPDLDDRTLTALRDRVALEILERAKLLVALNGVLEKRGDD